MKKILPIIGIAIGLTCVLLINVYSLPMHDELSYAFGGQSTPLTGVCLRVQSFADIVRQQWADYHANGNGRVIIHGLAAFFGGFRLYFLFDVLNTLVWAAFVFLLMLEGRIVVSIRSYWVCFCFSFWFLWYAESCSMNAVFAIDYLWCPTLTILMMMVWRRCSNRLLLVPVVFLFGWTQDASVLPFICAIAGSVALRMLVERRFLFSWTKIINFVFLVAGCAFLCLSPASMSRAGSTVGSGVLHSALALAPGFILYGVAPLFVAILAWVVWCNRNRLWAFLWKDLEWWMYLVAAFGLYVLCAPIAGNRLMMPWLMAGTIIIFRNREAFCLRRGATSVLCGIVMAWLAAVTVFQVMIGLDNKRMLAIYSADDQGITWRSPVPAPGYALSRGVFNGWHLSLFAREFSKDVPPVFFSRWIYDNVYQHPESFWLHAKPLEGCSGVFVSSECGYFAIKKGGSRFRENEMRCADAYVKDHGGLKSKWLPGRMSRMFPTSLESMDPLLKEFSFVAKDGNRYVIYCGGEYEPRRLTGEVCK